MQWAEEAVRRKRAVVPLPEGQSIGLELDFCTEESTESGIRVSRIDAGGMAEGKGVRQEDRLVVVGGVNVRGWGHALIREMILKRNGTLQLEFERPQPRPPQPRLSTDGPTGRRTPTGISSGSNGSSSSGNTPTTSGNGSSSNNGGAPSSAAQGSDGPKGTTETAAGLVSKNAAAPAATTPSRTESEPERQEATPSLKQHQLYRKLSGKRAKSAYTAAAAAALAKLVGASASSTATNTNAAKPFPIRKRRRRESDTDKGPVMPPPQAVHAPGDMLEQLDFLVAQQQSQQSQERAKQATRKQRLSLAPPPRRSLPPPPPPPPGKERRGGKGEMLAVDMVRQQLQEEDEHQQQLEQKRRQRQPWQQQQQQQQQQEQQQQQQHQQQQQQRREQEQQEETAAAANAGGAASGAHRAAVSSADTSATSTRRSLRRSTKRQQQQQDEGKRAEGAVTVNGVNTPSSSSPPPPPPWLDVLLGLEMTDFAGDGEAARAAVIVGEVREMEDKELMLLRRLHKVEPNMTFDGYAAFRSASLRGASAAYADLEALQGQHLKERQKRHENAEEEEAHQRELADLAMNGSFVSNLLMPKGCGSSDPAATVEPSRWATSTTASHSSSSSSAASASPTTTSEAGSGSRINGSNGRIAKDNSVDGDGDGDGGSHRPSQRRSRRRQQQQEEEGGEERQEEQQDEQEQEQEGQRPRQQKGCTPTPKPLSEKDVKTARQQVKTTAERIKFVKESHGGLQAVIRRSLACHERAIAVGDAHRAVRRQCLQDVKETMEAGRKTEKQAKEVLGKIRTWEGTARAGERLALEAAGAATQRAETLRDAVEFLMAGMETQNARMECLAMFRMLTGPMGAASSDSGTANTP